MKKISNLTPETDAVMTSDPFVQQDDFVSQLEAEFLTDDILEQAKAQIPHRDTRTDGQPMTITNIYFLLKLSDKYGDLIRKVYPYRAFTNPDNIEIPGRPANPKIMPIADKILQHEGIKASKQYLQDQLQMLNRSFGF